MNCDLTQDARRDHDLMVQGRDFFLSERKMNFHCFEGTCYLGFLSYSHKLVLTHILRFQIL